MDSKKFVFIVLHYITIDDTIKCVESILNRYKKLNIEIVIVDNASFNNTGEQLVKKYYINKRIHVLLNKKNLGFAKGNNVGFEYAKYNLNADFIIMINNDTVFIQDDFLDIIQSNYCNKKFAVMGPKILLPNDIVNPIILNIPSLKEAKAQLRGMRIDYITNMFYLDKLYKKFSKYIKRKFIRNNIIINETKNDYDKKYYNIVLHGCALIFSRKYIDMFDGLDDRTFLYKEEELLALRLKNNNLLSIYNPKLIIRHNEDSSTNAITKTYRKKRLFIDKYLIKSTKLLICELKKNTKKSISF